MVKSELSNLEFKSMDFVSQFKSIIRLCLFALPILLLGTSKHEYYLSIANLKFDENDKALEMSVWYFGDDLLQALRKEEGKEIEWEEEDSSTEEVLKKYIGGRLYLKEINSNKLQFQWVGLKFKGDLVYVYLRYPMEQMRDLRLHNSVLTEYFGEQKNVVHFQVNERNNTYYFDKKSTEVKLNVR
jgi:hypothetical protein